MVLRNAHTYIHTLLYLVALDSHCMANSTVIRMQQALKDMLQQ